MSLISAEFLRKIEQLEPALKDVLYPLVEEVEKPRDSVGRADFNELKDVVRDLAEAQKRTEVKVEELAEAQKRTEIKVEELAEAQKRTEIKVEELAEAQKKTEEEIRKLTREQRDMKVEIGGLSTTIGYTLENEAYKKLPGLLEKDYGIQVTRRLMRKFVQDIEGNAIEVNIFGAGKKDGKEVTIIGEAKSQLSINKVNDFLRKKVSRLQGLYGEVFLVLVTHMISAPGVEEYVKGKNIALFYSYDF